MAGRKKIVGPLSKIDRYEPFLYPQSIEFNLESIERTLRGDLERRVEAVSYISSSHLADLPILRAVHSLAPSEKIGMVIYDAHLDLFSRSGEEFLKNLKTPWKGNVPACQLEEELIVGAVIAGPGNESVEKTFSDPEVNSWEKSRLVFPLNSSSYVREGKVDRNTFIASLNEKVDEMVRTYGVTSVVITCDIDSLRTARMFYTAVEYTGLLTLSFLSTQEFPENADIKDLYKALNEIVFPARDISKRYRKGLKRAMPSLVEAAGGGLPLGLVGKSIDVVRGFLEERGINYGVPLPNGGRYVGSVTEFTGYDYKGKTARAAYSLAKRLVKF